MINDGMRCIWVEGFEGRYFAREDGYIFRVYKAEREPKQLIGVPGGRGYLQLSLTMKGKIRQGCVVHRIIAKAFIDNPEGFNTVDHIDGNVFNNAVSNLRWCSAQQNTIYYHKNRGADRILQDSKNNKEEVKKLYVEIERMKVELESMAQKLDKEREEVEQDKKKFNLFLEGEYEKFNVREQNYIGYKDIKGEKYESVSELISTVGKEVRVNGILFLSAGAAAKFIVDQEEGKNKATVSKDIRKYLQGKRKSWKMFGKYEIKI